MKPEHNPGSGPQHNPRRLRRSSESSRRSAPTRSRPATEIRRVLDTWHADGKAQGFSQETLTDRLGSVGRFCWWLENVEQVAPTLEEVNADRVRRFLTYCREPNEEGRFGNSHPHCKAAARPSTVHSYFRDIRALLNFCLKEELLDESPLRKMKAPKVPNDQVQPFSQEQIQALLDATARSAAPERNRAIILALLDTGLRVSELCSLRVKDADQVQGELSVVGKGGKRRVTYLGTSSRRTLKRYLARCRPAADEDEPLFTAESNRYWGRGMTRFGIQQVIRECGELAQITGVRCSPHTLRHTFAVSFLRGGGNLFELQRLMGHTDLTILRRYVALAESDLHKAHRAASPADRLSLK